MTQEGLSTKDSILKDLELHITMTHSQIPRGSRGQNLEIDIKPDKFPRPEISDPATDTDWQYFVVASWESYKGATKLNGK